MFDNNYSTMTRESLRKELRARGLKVGGLKADLVQRLMDDDMTMANTTAEVSASTTEVNEVHNEHSEMEIKEVIESAIGVEPVAVPQTEETVKTPVIESTEEHAASEKGELSQAASDFWTVFTDFIQAFIYMAIITYRLGKATGRVERVLASQSAKYFQVGRAWTSRAVSFLLDEMECSLEAIVGSMFL